MTVAKSWIRLDHQTECQMCGQKASKYFKEEQIAEGEEYRGNLRVIRRRPSVGEIGFPIRMSRWPNYSKADTDLLILWDGESCHQLKYGRGRFCKLRCAEEFAMLAHMNGWRVTK